MASITERGPYQWRAQVRRRGHASQSKTFATKAEAESWANMIESEMAWGAWVSRGKAKTATLCQALRRYETEISRRKRGSVQEASVLKIWMETALAKCPLVAIRTLDIAKLRDEWLEAYKPATVLRRLAVLSHVFSVARKEWGMESLPNPVELVRKPEPGDTRTRRLVAEVHLETAERVRNPDRRAQDGELDRVVAASESALLPPIVWLAVETALRRGEIVSLTWEYVDLPHRVIHLPATGNGTARDVPLSSRAIAILRSMKDRGRAKKSAPRDGAERSNFIFDIRGDAITRAFERAVARARKIYEDECRMARGTPDERFLVDLRFQDLRHEAACRLATIFPLHELARITGHKDLRMLTRYYPQQEEDWAHRLA
ncbi:site-specific integrase [Paraburkholderia phymatum]|uniref:Integrase family protein n=1 Tax=Paraburkholderia phymatum (strain DSM 17167 / CIP 108236 / LMG 21445 / STM815) TaxID=391038 RepID=B2JC71_PARP8|nr:site-specific integrase [Paraburkholderia phymatum]ACC69435.1 integrase family protein [Paraburkholderia phymatum STM815]